MAMANCKSATVKRVWGKRAVMAGAGLLLFLAVVVLTGCYHHAPYRVISQPAPEAARPRPSLTQVYFYPKAGQSPEQQSRDHYECYNWAVQQTGYDPGMTSLPPEQRIKVLPMPPPGHDTAALTIAGAVLGALIGGPRHGVGGAIIGAAGGAIVGAASDAARQEYARQMEEAYAGRDRQIDAQLDQKALDFRRATSACLEGRGYSVR